MSKRTVTDDEIGLIKAMLHFGMKNKDIQFYFNRQDRALNSGRITEIKKGKHPDIEPSPSAVLQGFMQSFAAPDVHAAPISAGASPAGSSSPLDPTILRRFFRESESGWICSVGETDQHECKTGFNLRRFGKALRTIAGFANNKGGYLFFGVRDKTDGYVICGLGDDRFERSDVSIFSQVIRSSLEPTPSFEVGSIVFGGNLVGVIYVSPHEAKPVIARKTEGDLTEGIIYFRYPGETRAISYPDLRVVLDERDRRSRLTMLPMVGRLLELGPKDALVANLAEGKLEGDRRPILLDESLLQRIKFIREGKFDEIDGAETLRLIGEVSAVPNGAIQPTRTVREEVTEDSIIRNFIRKQPIEQPLAYVRQASHEQSWLLPIFYYIFLAGQTKQGAVAALRRNKNAKPKTRDEMIRRLQGKRTLFSRAGGRRIVQLQRLRSQEIRRLQSKAEAKPIIDAMTALEQGDEILFPYVRELLSQGLSLWEATPEDRTFLSCLRKAASRLDELEYSEKIPEA